MIQFGFLLQILNPKEHRDEVNAKVMKEMKQQMEGSQNIQMPFDMKEMAYGGFKVKVEG